MEHDQSLPTLKQELLSPIVAMMPSPGMGHFIPMLEFANRLTRYHHLPVTIIIPTYTYSPPSQFQITLLRSLPRGISHIFLPPVNLSHLPPNNETDPLISLTILHSLPSIRDALHSLTASHCITAFVVDLFGTDAFDIAAELDVPPYVYYTSSAMALSFSLDLPRMDQELQCEYSDLSQPIQIALDRNSETYKWLLHHTKRFTLAKGIIDNTFPELEPETMEALQKEELPVYPVGPLVNEFQTGSHHCLNWLDDQPRGSVLFVCFGSGGTLSRVQMEELAHGLEMSEQRFLWVVKSPNDKMANASYFTADYNKIDFLPEGFVERTRERGLVVPCWAPQVHVLSHSSTGGFLSHCGWNSILESVVNGVPLVAWPLYAEQNMNADLVTQDIKVALRPRLNGVVERQEIASIVKNLMQGEDGNKLRDRMKDLKLAAATALAENGSSRNQISHLALKWQGKLN